MSADRGTDEENVVDKHWRKYYTAFQKVEILPFVTTRMNFEDLMLSEISQTQKDKCRVISFIRGTWNSDTHRSKEQKCQLPEPGRGEGGSCQKKQRWMGFGSYSRQCCVLYTQFAERAGLKGCRRKGGKPKGEKRGGGKRQAREVTVPIISQCKSASKHRCALNTYNSYLSAVTQ